MAEVARTRPAERPAVYHDVGAEDDFPVGKLTPVGVSGKDIWVLRRPDGGFYAVKNTCPHQGAPLCMGSTKGTWVPSEPGHFSFELENEVIICPNHKWEFSLATGRELFKETRLRIVRYEVKVEQGRVLVSSRGR